MVTWILQTRSKLHWDNWNDRIRAVNDATGHSTIEIEIVPFERSVVGGDPVIEGPVVAYGSTAIDFVVERHPEWSPALWRTNGVRESHVRAALGDLYANRDMVVCPVRDAADIAAERGWEFFFVKPNTDSKEFAGTVTDQQKYPFFIEGMLAHEWVAEDFEVCVSPILDLGIEWRLPVVDGRVVDYSIYKQWREVMPKREIYQDVLNFAAEAIALHDPAPVYVIDIAQVGDELKVIEYNGFNSAGLYDCDVPNVVNAINQYVEREYGN